MTVLDVDVDVDVDLDVDVDVDVDVDIDRYTLQLCIIDVMLLPRWQWYM